MRTVLNSLGFLVGGLGIGYVLARPLNRVSREMRRNEIVDDFPADSERERQWRVRLAGLDGTSRTAL